MASQRVLVLTLGGALADDAWARISRWSDQRQTRSTQTWSPEDWDAATRTEVAMRVDQIIRSGFGSPVLYRTEHWDSWSMGDVFRRVTIDAYPECSRLILLEDCELYARWITASVEFPPPPRDDHAESRWLWQRLCEAAEALRPFADAGLLLLLRVVYGGLCTDDETRQSLSVIPSWWRENDDSNRRDRIDAS